MTGQLEREVPDCELGAVSKFICKGPMRLSGLSKVQIWANSGMSVRAYRRLPALPMSGRHVLRSSRLSPFTRLGAHQITAFHEAKRQLQPVTSDNGTQSATAVSAAPVAPAYSPPTTGLLSTLPSSWVPYAELVRLDKPAGTYYLFFPCLFSTLLAAPITDPITTPAVAAGYSALFFTGALIMRGAGCAVNDLWDRNLDPHVARTRLRPIARGAITPFKGLVFTGFQMLAGLGVLVQFPFQCLFYGIPSLLFVGSYPLAKRVTYYPQFVLGLTFSWGAIMGYPALGLDLLSNTPALTSAACLYASCVSWTVLYDMIYAHMDIKDDAKAGIKSIALKHDAETKQVLSALAVTQVGLLAAAGYAVGAGPVFFVGSCGGALATLGYMIKRVNLKSVKDCWWWFINGCWITGGAISLGLVADYAVRYSERQQEPETLEDDTKN